MVVKRNRADVTTSVITNSLQVDLNDKHLSVYTLSLRAVLPKLKLPTSLRSCVFDIM